MCPTSFAVPSQASYTGLTGLLSKPLYADLLLGNTPIWYLFLHHTSGQLARPSRAFGRQNKLLIVSIIMLYMYYYKVQRV